MMITSKGLRWSGQLISHGRRRQAVKAHGSTSHSTSHTVTRQFTVSSTRPLIRSLPAYRRHPLSSISQFRFASTSSTPSAIPIAQPNSTHVETSITTPLEEATDLSTFDFKAVPEKIGFLKELGLDYGWGPTATVQWLLEHIYVYSGLPWWATIIATTAVLRIVMFKFSQNAIETGTRMRFMEPYIKPIKAKLEMAKSTKDRTAMMEAQQEMAQLYSRSNIKLKNLFYPLIQIPFAYGSFRLVRGMATLPVPGFESGGIFWFTDLSLSDPYFLLPMMTSGVMFATFKLNEMAGAQSGTNPTMILLLKWILPIGAFLISCRFPAGLSLLFFSGSLMQLSQTSLFISNRFRKWAGMTPRPPRVLLSASTPPSSGPTTLPAGTTGVDGKQVGFVAGAIRDLKGVKEQAQKMMERQGEGTQGAKGKAKINQEQAYEAKRSRQEAEEAAKEKKRWQEKRKKQKKNKSV